MSWSLHDVSDNAVFGSRSGSLEESSEIRFSLSVDVMESWCVEFWFYKEGTGPCTLLRSGRNSLHLMVNRRGNYLMRLSGQHHRGKSCEVSRIYPIPVGNQEWTHVCVQYDKRQQVYTLFSKGSMLITQRYSNLKVNAFDMVQIGGEGFAGNVDSVRVSSCVRYKHSEYEIPVSSFTPDAYTLTLNDFEDPVFVVNDGVVQTEDNWSNLGLNKSQVEYMTGSKSLVIAPETQILPRLVTPDIDMNAHAWTVEFFWKILGIFDGARVILRRGSISIVVSPNTLRLLDDTHVICTIRMPIPIGEWNHVCLCHDFYDFEFRLLLGINGTVKKCKTRSVIEKDVDIVVGSTGGKGRTYYDNFRLSSDALYEGEYQIPSPQEDSWSCLDYQTILYTGFEDPDFTASNVTSFSVLLSWESHDADNAEYTVFINGVKSIYSTEATDCTVYGLKESTEYEFSIYNGDQKLFRSLSVMTLPAIKDNSFNVLSSISTQGKYDMSKLPSRMRKDMDMDSVFDNRDRIIIPVNNSRIHENVAVANFTRLSSVVEVASSTVILVPFRETGETIDIKGDDGSLTKLSFIEGNVEIDGNTVRPGGYGVVGGKKMRVKEVM